LYSILTDFGVSMNLVKLIKMCLSEDYNRVRIGKNLSDIIYYWEWFETRGCFIAFAFELCHRIRP